MVDPNAEDQSDIAGDSPSTEETEHLNGREPEQPSAENIPAPERPRAREAERRGPLSVIDTNVPEWSSTRNGRTLEWPSVRANEHWSAKRGE